MPTSPGDCAANPESLVARGFARRARARRRHRSRRAASCSTPTTSITGSTTDCRRSLSAWPSAPTGPAPTTGRARRASTTSRSTNRSLGTSTTAGIAASFDLTLSEEFQVDHSITVPVHFLAASDGVVERPIVPVWINGIAPPFPLAARCRDLGAMVSSAVTAYPG